MKFLVGLLVVLVIAVGGVVLYLDRIVATAIEQSGTYALGVETGVDSVSIGLLSGHSAIRGLAVANPPGFDRPHFLRMEEASVDLRFHELLGDPVAVQRLSIRGVDVSLERRGGKLNYAPILEHLEQFAAEDPEAAPAEDDAVPAKGFVIREVVIERVRAHASLVPRGGKLMEVNVEVPEVRLENVGSESEGGVDLAELTGILTTAVLEAVASQGGKLPSGLAGDLKGRLRDLPDVDLELPKSSDDLEERLRGSESDVVEEGRKAVEGLKGLFDRD